ncbi:MAG: retroviral-like aspartic protease family protein [bacterium]
MPKHTPFDTSEHHIYVACHLVDWHGLTHAFRAIVDTGAPVTEFSDEFLAAIGLVKIDDTKEIKVTAFEQTKRYAKLVLPKIEYLGQVMVNTSVKVSRFAEGWGVDALIGLDFFRMFRVTVDYMAGQIVTESY